MEFGIFILEFIYFCRMKQNFISLRVAYLLVILILIVDQLSKIYIKTNFFLGEEVEVFSWFKIYFIENEGMAWGTKIPGEYGKLFLTCLLYTSDAADE